MKALVLIVVLINVAANDLYSYRIHPGAGTTSASFLKIPVGSRASSFNGGYTSIRDDIFGVFYNPASTSITDRKVFSIFHNIYLAQIKQFVISFGFQPELVFNDDKDYISFHINYLTYGNLEKRSGIYETNYLSPSHIEGNFTASDILVKMNYSTEFDNFSVGGNFNFILQNIYNEKADAFAVDIGVIKTVDYVKRSFDVGFSIMNLGSKIKFINSSYSLPLTFRFGFSTVIDNYVVSFDVIKYIDNYPFFIFALERKVSNLFIRSSYKYRFYGNEHGFWSGFSLGCGLRYRNIDFDYSLNNFGDLGLTHGINLSFKY